MLTNGLRSLFLAQASIVALAPAQTVGRVSIPAVFCEDAPEGFRPPYVVIKHVGTDPLLSLDSTYNESLKADSVDVESVAYSVADSLTLGDTIRRFFDDYTGNVTADGITDVIKAVQWQNHLFDYDYPQDGSDRKHNQSIHSFLIHYEQGA